jgi:hypothetical protein
MKTRNIVAAIGVMLVVSSVASAADKQTIKSRDGSCQVSVPANWTPGEVGEAADAPDHKVTMAVSSPKMIDSYSDAKQMAQTVYKNSKVTVNSPTENSPWRANPTPESLTSIGSCRSAVRRSASLK